MAKCETTANNIFQKIFKDMPSAIDNVNCSVQACGRNKEIKKPVVSLTNCTNSKDLLYGLQNFVTQRMSGETKECKWAEHNGEQCKGLPTTNTHISEMYLFIDILNWDGILHYYNSYLLILLFFNLI